MNGPTIMRPDLSVADRRSFDMTPPLPRLTATQLAAAPHYRDLLLPFVLTGNMSDSWHVPVSNESWLDSLASTFPQGVAESGNTLTRLPRAVRAVFSGDRYLLFQIPPQRWGQLAAQGQLPNSTMLPPSAGDDAAPASWLDDCLREADSSSPKTTSEWFLKTHWSQVAAGARGAGMRNHTDALHTGSWHAHVAGRKKWRICGGDDAHSQCFEDVVEAGEVLYYGARWSHETLCLETPTISVSSAVVQRAHARVFAEQILDDCAFARPGKSLYLSGALCDAWEGCAATLLRRLSVGAPDLLAWRDRARQAGAAKAAAAGIGSAGVATARRMIRKREDVQAHHYTYEALSLPLNAAFYQAQGFTIAPHDYEASSGASGSAGSGGTPREGWHRCDRSQEAWWPPEGICTVARVSNAHEALVRARSGGEPFLFEDSHAPQRAPVAAWRKEHVLARHGQQPVSWTFTAGCASEHATSNVSATDSRCTTKGELSAYVQRFCSGNCTTDNAGAYVFVSLQGDSYASVQQAYAPPRVLEELMQGDTYPRDAWELHKDVCTPNLALGSVGSGLSFHAHGDAWTDVLSGSKTWFLCPPGCPAAVLQLGGSNERLLATLAAMRTDAPSPDVSGEQALWQEQVTVCTQRHNEVLFVPEGWHHGVLNRGETLSITQNCRSRSRSRGRSETCEQSA